AVRAAIGAGRERVVRQLMTEHLLLAAAGGALGIGLAILAVPLLSQLVPPTLPIAASPTLHAPVIRVAVALHALTRCALRLALVRLGRDLDVGGLRDGARSGGGQRERLRSALVFAEVVASVVLLVSAALLIRALLTIQATDPGFDVNGVLTLRAELPVPQYARVATRETFHSRVLREVRALPGVKAAGFTSLLPISRFRGGLWPVTVAGDVPPGAGRRGVHNVAALRYVTPGYVAALAIPLSRGRDVSEADTQHGPL